MNKTRFVEADEICTELGICKRTLSRWVDDGRFPAPLRLKLRQRVWLRREYQDAIAERAETPEPEQVQATD